MFSINCRNAHTGLPLTVNGLLNHGAKRDSRNGPVYMFPMPCTVIFKEPIERVVFWPQRDANPFFHLFESLWMLAGRNDVEPVAYFAGNMRSFSDDGETFNAAYGYRWRKWFRDLGNSYDQLDRIVEALKANPDCRRQVLAMWDGHHDLGLQSKDIPCNTHAYFQIDPEGRLNMMVCNRSNDTVWGTFGANAVHFSFLLEYMAAKIGVPMGRYWQTSMNLHGYEATLEKVAELGKIRPEDLAAKDPYVTNLVKPITLIHHKKETMDQWDSDLSMFMEDPQAIGFQTRFFKRLMPVVMAAFKLYKEEDKPHNYKLAIKELQRLNVNFGHRLDWGLAMEQWLIRRLTTWEEKQRAEDDGVQHG